MFLTTFRSLTTLLPDGSCAAPEPEIHAMRVPKGSPDPAGATLDQRRLDDSFAAAPHLRIASRNVSYGCARLRDRPLSSIYRRPQHTAAIRSSAANKMRPFE
jgi:hypothetical protein